MCVESRDSVHLQRNWNTSVFCQYPPDLLHDLFEGIVPRDLALCLQVFIKSKYFTLDELNKKIKTFPYKWSDKTDAPQQVPLNFAAKKSVGGNAHENLSLLQFLPLIIGSKIPEGEPTWEVLLVLKDIVELVVSHVHTEESICYLDSKISEHRLLCSLHVLISNRLTKIRRSRVWCWPGILWSQLWGKSIAHFFTYLHCMVLTETF